LFTLRQLAELDVSGSVAIYALKERLPLVDVIKEIAELVDVNGASVVPVKHVCAGENADKRVMIFYSQKLNEMIANQGCQNFIGARYQNGKKYTKSPRTIPNVHKI
jgi:hypothetical protein